MSTGGKIKLFFTHNWRSKLIALFLAIVCWIYTISQQKFQDQLNYSLIIKKPNYLVVTNTLPGNILVKLFGSKITLQELKNDEHQILLDLEKYSEGETSHAIYPEKLDLPSDIEVVSISPSTVKIVLEEQISKLVPLKPNFVGTPKDGLVIDLYTTTITPAQIKIYGPKSKLANIEFITTKPISLDKRTTSYFENCTPVAPGSLIQFPTVDLCQVKVVLKDNPEIIIRQTFANIPIQFKNKTKLKILINPAKMLKVTLSGPKNLIKTLQREAIVPVLTVDRWDDRITSLPPEFNPLEGLEFIEWYPETIEILNEPKNEVAKSRRRKR